MFAFYWHGILTTSHQTNYDKFIIYKQGLSLLLSLNVNTMYIIILRNVQYTLVLTVHTVWLMCSFNKVPLPTHFFTFPHLNLCYLEAFLSGHDRTNITKVNVSGSHLKVSVKKKPRWWNGLCYGLKQWLVFDGCLETNNLVPSVQHISLFLTPLVSQYNQS